MTGRPLLPVPARTGRAALDLLPLLAAALAGDGPALLPHAAEHPPDARLGPGTPLLPDEDDPSDPTAVVIVTSGSSGRPKGTLLPAAALLASAAATHDRLGGPGRWLLALPTQYVAGLQVLTRSLVARTEPVALDLTHGFDPRAFVQASDRLTGPRRYTALVPDQLARLLDAGAEPAAALARYDAVLVGGAGIPQALRERAAAAGVAMVASYGMSETCGGCVYDGRPLDGVRIERADGDRLLVGGPVLARGYRLDRELTAACFVVGTDGGRLLRTDDAGMWDGERLRLFGRLDSIINTGGVKVDPTLVEDALLRLDEVAQAAVIGVDDARWGQRVVAAVVARPGRTVPALATVREAVGERVSRFAAPQQLLVLESIPLRGTGKPDLTALRALADADADGAAHDDPAKTRES